MYKKINVKLFESWKLRKLTYDATIAKNFGVHSVLEKLQSIDKQVDVMW